MHRIDTSTAQKDKFGAGKNGFTSGDAQIGIPATEVSPEILDAIQEEIAAVIEDQESGIALDKSNNHQLIAAIKSIIDARSVNLNTLKTMLVGVPLPCPTAIPPNGFISIAGQAINKETDPLLYARYGGIAPDLRGVVVRGWDNGRGIDIARALLSEQGDAGRNATGNINFHGGSPAGTGATPAKTGSGVFGTSGATIQSKWVPAYNPQAADTSTDLIDLNLSRQWPVASEFRMRNSAWHYMTLRG